MSESIEWVNTKDASNYLGVTLRTLYRLIDEGSIPAYKIGRVIRLQQEDLNKFISSTKIEPGTLEHLYPENKATNVSQIPKSRSASIR